MDDSVFDKTRSFPFNASVDDSCMWVNGNFVILILSFTFIKNFFQSPNIIKFNGINNLTARGGTCTLDAESLDSVVNVAYFCPTVKAEIWMACHGSGNKQGGHFNFTVPYLLKFL